MSSQVGLAAGRRIALFERDGMPYEYADPSRAEADTKKLATPFTQLLGSVRSPNSQGTANEFSILNR